MHAVHRAGHDGLAVMDWLWDFLYSPRDITLGFVIGVAIVFYLLGGIIERRRRRRSDNNP